MHIGCIKTAVTIGVACCLSVHASANGWLEMRYNMLLQQGRDYTCGAASLATIIKYYYGGNNITQDMILDQLPEEKASFGDLKKVSVHFGFNAVGLHLSMDDLFKIKSPVIAYIRTPLNNYHFVVVKGVLGERVYVGDPSVGNYMLSKGEFYKVWALEGDGRGSILYVHKDGNYSGEFFHSSKSPLAVRHIFGLKNIPR